MKSVDKNQDSMYIKTSKTITPKNTTMTTYTSTEIKKKANGLSAQTVIPNNYEETEYLAVTLKFGVTAFFLMNNTTFDFTYSHTYNALTDKTTKRTPNFIK